MVEEWLFVKRFMKKIIMKKAWCHMIAAHAFLRFGS
jgi:hypothetical protein